MDSSYRCARRMASRPYYRQGLTPFRGFGPRRGMGVIKLGLLGTIGYYIVEKLSRDDPPKEQNALPGKQD